MKRRRFLPAAAARHAAPLAELFGGSGDPAPARGDVDFRWPRGTFRLPRTAAAGTQVPAAVLGVGQTASAAVANPVYRVLYASLAASAAQQLAALAPLAGRLAVEPSPVALDLETASAALERYLG